MRDLLECVWPAALQTARQPFRSRTWIGALAVIVDRDRGEFGRTRRLGAVRFEQVVRREILRRGGQKPSLRILRRLVAALTDPAGVIAHRRGALERVQPRFSYAGTDDGRGTDPKLDAKRLTLSCGGFSVRPLPR